MPKVSGRIHNCPDGRERRAKGHANEKDGIMSVNRTGLCSYYLVRHMSSCMNLSQILLDSSNLLLGVLKLEYGLLL